MARFSAHRQLDAFDCGPTCLLMVAESYGKKFSRDYLRKLCSITNKGVSLLGIANAAERIGLRPTAVKIDYDVLRKEATLPTIIHWGGNHFVVANKIKKNRIWIADPGRGLVSYTKSQFLKHWAGPVNSPDEEPAGIVLLLEATPEFYDTPLDETQTKQEHDSNLKFFLRYLSPHKALIVQVALGMMFGLVLEMMIPFITQSVVDFGIGNMDIGIVYLLLIAQLVISFSQIGGEMLRSWIWLHVGSRISISLIANFLHKLLKLPMSFFETRTVGDIMQRVSDHDRIQEFLTSGPLNTFFSILKVIVFGGVLAFYSIAILVVFLGFTVLSIVWIFLFLKKRRQYDGERFELESKQNDHFIQLVSGIQDIKIQGIAREKRWGWEKLAAKLLKLDVKTLSLSQFQSTGTFLFSKLREVGISFLAAKAVIDGDMTLGMMLSTTYIVGQLNQPISSMVATIQSAQDAKVSLERIKQIYTEEDEEDQSVIKIQELPSSRSIDFVDASFSYPGPIPVPVIQKMNLSIPQGKTTAIVGSSGSGKTTLLKMLLALYKLQEGAIQIGPHNLEDIDKTIWRSSFGVVLQDGFIFSDTIAGNIASGPTPIDYERLSYAIFVASLGDFIESLPAGLDTAIGLNGRELSGGQKQRVLIARAVYQDPAYLVFDEATSALDAQNEAKIMGNLEKFIKGRTVVVVAHRLSTVLNADQIVVLDQGQIVELGSHSELLAKKGRYFNLVKNQLQLESL